VLEKEIGDVRKQVLGAYSDAHAHVQGWVSKWIGVEHAFESAFPTLHEALIPEGLNFSPLSAGRVKSIIAPDEAVTPGLLYSGVAGLTGSILARNRILPTRLLLPPIFLFATANYFLPKTTGNLTTYLGDLEDTYVPEVAQKHDIAKAHSAMAWARLKDATANGRAKLDESAGLAVHKIQEATGLKLKETLGWQKAKIAEAATRVQQEAVHVKEISSTEIKALQDKAAIKAEKVEEKVEEKVAGEVQKAEAKIEKVDEKADDEAKRLV
jgi:organizing structure protein 2